MTRALDLIVGGEERLPPADRPRGRRVPYACALVAGLLLAGAGPVLAEATFEASIGPEQVEQTPAEAATPTVLGPQDAQRYARIFRLQKAGRMSQADAEIARLDDRILMGHVLFQRYMHPTAHHSTYAELSGWLRRYADHPDAARIYKLTLHRQPKGAPPPVQPSELVLPLGPWTEAAETDGASGDAGRMALSEREAGVLRRVAHEVRNGERDAAERILAREQALKPLSATAYDHARTRLAAGQFFAGHDDKAYALAAASAKRSRRFVESADWIAGLAAWRLGRTEAAERHFEALARSHTASPWNVAAGAYWAARCYLVHRKPRQVSPMLALAAAHPRTFYGLLAARWLDKDLPFDWQAPPLGQADMDALMKVPAIRRVVALAEAGRYDLADLELRSIYVSGKEALGTALVGLANRLNIPATQLRLAQSYRQGSGQAFDAALFPMPPWEPKDGFLVDRALVYALIRQESGFEVKATSQAGARGLMQIMPTTASFVANDESLQGSGKDRLLAPEYNLEIGQRYLEHLLKNANVRGNLIYLAVAYNSGPGTLAKWLKALNHKDDPLLFMEGLPSRETRFFVERVLTNFWIYRQRLKQDTPSLDAIASGHWPYYLTLDREIVEVAQHHGRD
jgi:peptidoglycan lytic transglycosylase